MTFVRTTLFIVLLSQFAVSPTATDAKSPFLIIEAATNVEGGIGSAFDVRDLEHFVVAQFLRQRVEGVVPSSSAEDLQPGDGSDVYVLTLTVEQLEEASRPRWDWADRRYVDEEMLHLEVSLVLTHGEGGATVGTLHDIRDYRAEDFGSFAQPQAVRAVVYQAATKLADRFVSAASNGGFGETLRSIQRSETPADLVNDWQELPLEWKLLSAMAAALLFVFLFGISVRFLLFASRLASCVLLPRGRRPPAYVLADDDDEKFGS